MRLSLLKTCCYCIDLYAGCLIIVAFCILTGIAIISFPFYCESVGLPALNEIPYCLAIGSLHILGAFSILGLLFKKLKINKIKIPLAVLYHGAIFLSYKLLFIRVVPNYDKLPFTLVCVFLLVCHLYCSYVVISYHVKSKRANSENSTEAQNEQTEQR